MKQFLSTALLSGMLFLLPSHVMAQDYPSADSQPSPAAQAAEPAAAQDSQPAQAAEPAPAQDSQPAQAPAPEANIYVNPGQSSIPSVQTSTSKETETTKIIDHERAAPAAITGDSSNSTMFLIGGGFIVLLAVVALGAMVSSRRTIVESPVIR